MTRRKMFNRFGPYLVCYFVFALILGVQSGLFDPDQQEMLFRQKRLSKTGSIKYSRAFGVCGKANGPGADPSNTTIQTMSISEMPWLTFIYFSNSVADNVWCSGSIIGSKWILTAASCLDADVYRVDDELYGFIGFHSYDIQNQDLPNRISIDNLIDNVFLHPQWNKTTRNADIALIHLKTDITFNNYTSPVCLPNPGEPVSGSVTLTGWGTIAGKMPSIISSVPRKASASIVNDSHCQQQASLSNDTSGNICIVGDPSGSYCIGEPGGSVNFKNPDGSWSVIGIVSYDFNPFSKGFETNFLHCMYDPSTPRAFTRVSSYLDWIKNLINDGILISSSTIESTATIKEKITSSKLTTVPTSTYQQSSTSINDKDPIILPTLAVVSSSPTTPAPFTVPVGLCGKAKAEGADPNYPEIIQAMIINEFPWLAYFYFGDSFEDKMWCTGSIIGPKWLMTAASCLDEHRNPGKLHGFIGVHNIDPNLIVAPRHRIPIDNLIDRFFQHPQWNKATMYADIALIRLNRDVQYSKYIMPICLPKPNDPILVDGQVTLAGWGVAGNEGTEMPVSYKPRKAAARIVNNLLCGESLINATTSDKICIQGDPSGSFCVGESGGPVNFKNADNSWTAIGIVSYQHYFGGCQNDSSIPRPFTRVRSYLEWINCIMSDGRLNSLCPNESITTNTSQISRSTAISSVLVSMKSSTTSSSTPSTAMTKSTTSTTLPLSTTTQPFRGCRSVSTDTPKRCDSTRSSASIMTIIEAISFLIFIL